MLRKRLDGMKHEQVFLKHILDEVDFLLKETEGMGFEEFMKTVQGFARNESLLKIIFLYPLPYQTLYLPNQARQIAKSSSPEGGRRSSRIRVDEAKMVAFDFLQCFFKTHFILYPWEVIWNPISQRRKSAFPS